MKTIFLIMSAVVAGLPVFRIGSLPYDLSKPSTQVELPPQLHEISGITPVENKLACIQDENGIVFMVDPVSGNIIEEIPFGPDGDYEDIALAGNSLFVLRSDGTLFEISDYNSQERSVTEVYTGIPGKDNEGLCLDKGNNRLLIAVKGKSGKGKKYKDRRDVYAFDLKKRKLVQKPVLTMHVDEVREVAQRENIQLPVKFKKKGKVREEVLRLSTSAIAVHPTTGNLFLLSSTDHLLLVFDTGGKLLHLKELDHYQFNKPEGLAFASDGTMYITNEGVNRKPTLFSFASNSRD